MTFEDLQTDDERLSLIQAVALLVIVTGLFGFFYGLGTLGVMLVRWVF